MSWRHLTECMSCDDIPTIKKEEAVSMLPPREAAMLLGRSSSTVASTW